MKAIVAALSVSALLSNPHQASAWGAEGHMTVAQIAEHYLEPAIKARLSVAPLPS